MLQLISDIDTRLLIKYGLVGAKSVKIVPLFIEYMSVPVAVGVPISDEVVHEIFAFVLEFPTY